MTTKDMLYACDVKVKNITKSDEIDIKTTDWLVFLNQGQEEIFRTIIPLNASTETQFDLSPMSRNNLAALIKDKQYVPAESKSYVNNKMTGSTYTFEYPSDLKYIDYAEVVLTKNGKDYISRVKDTEPRYYFQNRKNPFKKPYSELVWRRDFGQNTKGYNEIVIPEGFSLKYFTLRYLIELTCMSLETDSLLAESLHWDIVNKAVDLCIDSHQKNLYLTNLAQNNQ